VCPRAPQHNDTAAAVSNKVLLYHLSNGETKRARRHSPSAVLMSTYCADQSPPEVPATSIPSPPPEPQSLTKHADLWFCDGSVILQAESTLFRVHKSQLSRRSIVFSDMFALAQPPIMTTHATLADENYEGCPVVKLHDSAEDVANLLLALYDGPFVPSFLFFFTSSGYLHQHVY
jgi:hypothetical protein